jgi:hypothetical protein
MTFRSRAGTPPASRQARALVGDLLGDDHPSVHDAALIASGAGQQRDRAHPIRPARRHRHRRRRDGTPAGRGAKSWSGTLAASTPRSEPQRCAAVAVRSARPANGRHQIHRPLCPREGHSQPGTPDGGHLARCRGTAASVMPSDRAEMPKKEARTARPRARARSPARHRRGVFGAGRGYRAEAAGNPVMRCAGGWN